MEPPTGIPLKEIKATLATFESDFDKNMSPQMTASWRVYLDKGNGVKNSWLLDSELIVENGRRELWSITRKPGEIGFSFSLDPNNDSPNRYVIRRPARSGNYIHVPCHDGEVFTIDQFGNLEYRSYFPFETSNEPSATDRFVLVSADTDRFFYAWDVVNNRYQKRRRMDEISGCRSVATGSRVYFACDDGQVHALSLDNRDFFEIVWSKKSFSDVVSPLKLNVEAAQLYVATRPDGVVTCYSTHNGAILWSRPAECEIEDEMVVDTRYMKDRIYVITKNGDEVNGVWAIKTIDPAAGKEGDVLWKYAGADKILALGKEHIYVRTGSPGAYKIALIRTSDGKLEREFSVPQLVQERGLWYTNSFGPQLIIGINYKGRVGMWLSLTEAE